MSWKTAQTTGAVAYMPYKDAENFSEVYLLQSLVYQSEMQLGEEMTNSASLFVSHPDDWVMSPAQIDVETERIGRMQIRLLGLSGIIDQLDTKYKDFESEHK